MRWRSASRAWEASSTAWSRLVRAARAAYPTNRYDRKVGTMAVEKITVSLPADLVAAIDRFSTEEGVSRSSVVAEAAAVWLSEREEAAAAARRHEAARALFELLDSLESVPPLDDTPPLDMLREARGPLGGGRQ
ncbi:MAG: ribbon-helix-helix protein, CopG family [Actinobacteria bacterium]|nr:ribbon-helix-helix protein, CopG family [Actinomycetota bacterium]